MRTGFIPVSEYEKLLESHHAKEKESGNTQIAEFPARIAGFPIPGKYYNVVAKHSELFLNVSGGDKNSGAQLIQYDKSEDDGSKWRLEEAGDGYFYLISKHSGKVANIAGGSSDNGTSIIQFERNEDNGSKWRLEEAGDGYFYLISKHTGKVLQVNSGDWGNLAQVTQWEKIDMDHHKWKFVVV